MDTKISDNTRTCFEAGAIVLSLAGRDKNKFFVVLKNINSEFCMIADGRTRKLAKPKLKKIKHLKPTGEIVPTLREKLNGNAKVFDSEIYSCLRKYNTPEQKKSD